MTITINGTTGIAGVDGSAGTPAVQGADTNTGIFFGTDTVTISTGGTAAVTVDSGQRTKFPTTIGVGGATPSTSGSGISFPASASASSDANTLDDYEEGTFTPTAIGGSTAGTTTYVGSPVGSYTKVGRLVTAKAGLTYSSLTGTGELVLNLPFTSDAEYQGSIMTDGMNWPVGALSVVLYAVTSTATARVFFSGDDIAWQVQPCVNEQTGIQFTITYFTS
jgi:hypothetical protein